MSLSRTVDIIHKDVIDDFVWKVNEKKMQWFAARPWNRRKSCASSFFSLHPASYAVLLPLLPLSLFSILSVLFCLLSPSHVLLSQPYITWSPMKYLVFPYCKCHMPQLQLRQPPHMQTGSFIKSTCLFLTLFLWAQDFINRFPLENVHLFLFDIWTCAAPQPSQPHFPKF